jgi:hypothetical protein
VSFLLLDIPRGSLPFTHCTTITSYFCYYLEHVVFSDREVISGSMQTVGYQNHRNFRAGIFVYGLRYATHLHISPITIPHTV